MRPPSGVLLLASLLAIALLAAVALSYATPQGLGLSDDSIAYIAGARSLLQGRGYREIWLASSQPVTHLPPGYPAALAFLGKVLGLDPLRGTRFLNLALLGSSTIAIGILGWWMTRLWTAGVVLAALFATNPSVIRLYADALSEPLYIFLSLLSFLAFAQHLRDPDPDKGPGASQRGLQRLQPWVWLAACGALVGAAYLTRYAGLALVLSFLLALPLLHRRWDRILSHAGAFLAGALPLIAAWSLRNRWLGGTATNRALGWHPITAENVEMAVYNVSTFLVPIESWRRALVRSGWLLDALLGVLAACFLVWLGRVVLAGLRGRRGAPAEPIALLVGLYSAAYLGSVIVAMSFFDASTKFALRILSPLFVSALVLLVAAGAWLWRAGSQRLRLLVIVAGLSTLAVSLYGSGDAVTVLHQGGQGYASFKWYDSSAMAFLRDLPVETRIYTNEPAAVYLYTDRGCYVLPDRLDPVTREPRPGFEQGVADLRADVLSGDAVLALFDDRDLGPGEAEALTEGLSLVHKSAGDEIYAVPSLQVTR